MNDLPRPLQEEDIKEAGNYCDDEDELIVPAVLVASACAWLKRCFKHNSNCPADPDAKCECYFYTTERIREVIDEAFGAALGDKP